MSVKINGIINEISHEHFIVVNRGSSISIAVDQQCQPFLLYFINGAGDDWNITERIYEATPSLKERIKTLVSLTNSCSSFISMQSDVIIRSTLAEIVSLNDFSAKLSMKLEVKKKGTREDNFKKLATARDWIENNFSNLVRPVVGKPVPIVAYAVFLDHSWSNKFTSAIGYSAQDNDNTDGQAPDAFRVGQYALGNLLYNPVPNVMVGGELQWGRRENFSDGFHSDGLKLQFSFKYNFSWKLGG